MQTLEKKPYRSLLYGKFYLLFVFLIFIQCKSDLMYDGPESYITPKSDGLYDAFTEHFNSESKEKLDELYTVLPAEAAEIAVKSLEYQSNSSQKREGYQVESIRRIGDETGETLVYIIQFIEGGYSLISADKRYFPVLTESGTGFWGRADTLGGIRDWLQMIKSEIAYVKAKYKVPHPNAAYGWGMYEYHEEKSESQRNNSWECGFHNTSQYGSYIKPIAEWNQGGSLQYFTPVDGGCTCGNKPAGCGPIAMGMIMRYHQYPQMSMSFNGYSMYTDYNAMPHVNSEFCSLPDYGDMNAALLVRLAGNAASAGYGILGSCDTYTLPWNLSSGFSNLFYSSGGTLGSYSSKFSTMKTDLKAGYPVIYVGTTGTLNFSNAHIWVGDGLKETYGTYGYEHPIEDMDPTILYYYDPDTGCMNYHYHYVSFVWGWESTGINDWYYAGELLGYFNNYDTYLHILTGIRP